MKGRGNDNRKKCVCNEIMIPRARPERRYFCMCNTSRDRGEEKRDEKKQERGRRDIMAFTGLDMVDPSLANRFIFWPIEIQRITDITFNTPFFYANTFLFLFFDCQQ